MSLSPGESWKFIRFIKSFQRRLCLTLIETLSISWHLSFLRCNFNPLGANPTKWSNTLRQFVGCCRRIVWVCLTILWGWRSKDYYKNMSKLLTYFQINIRYLWYLGITILLDSSFWFEDVEVSRKFKISKVAMFLKNSFITKDLMLL